MSHRQPTRRTQVVVLDDIVRERLALIQGDIWDERDGRSCHGPTRWSVEKRKLTTDEWEFIRGAAPAFVVEPTNACMGFNFGLNIYATPVAPGAPPEHVLSITGAHFGTRFAESWAKMSPLSHNPSNEARLKLYGFETLRERDYYDY